MKGKQKQKATTGNRRSRETTPSPQSSQKRLKAIDMQPSSSDIEDDASSNDNYSLSDEFTLEDYEIDDDFFEPSIATKSNLGESSKSTIPRNLTSHTVVSESSSASVLNPNSIESGVSSADNNPLTTYENTYSLYQQYKSPLW